MLLYKALELSIEKDLDLVEVSPNANPPVCKILDYGKFRYQIQREKKKVKKKQHIVQVKEIRLRPAISDHDLLTKLTKAKNFIENGCKLKFTVFFKGRERSRMDTGLVLLERVIEILDDYAKVEKTPDTEANKMTLIMVPK